MGSAGSVTFSDTAANSRPSRDKVDLILDHCVDVSEKKVPGSEQVDLPAHHHSFICRIKSIFSRRLLSSEEASPPDAS